MENSLYRDLLNGKQFDHLIPKSKCDGASGNSGNGDTDHSISKMIQAVKQFSHQTDQLAYELEEDTLPETIASIHWFLFNHIQYLEDDEEQILRSPACSWKSRVSGIDCKNYSIFASSICNSLQIAHFIRKVNYTDVPEAYSHVYVIVPVDQEKQDLNKGYFIIDGTLEYNNEINFIEKKDYKMVHTTLAKPNYGMNGWQDILNSSGGQIVQAGASGGIESAITTGLNFIPYGSTIVTAFKFLKNFDFNKIKDIIKHIDCWGGSAFNNDEAQKQVTKIFVAYQQKLDVINGCIIEKRFQDLSHAYHELLGTIHIVQKTIDTKISEGWNSCSTEALRIVQETNSNFLNNFYEKFTFPYFDAFFVSNGALNFKNYVVQDAVNTGCDYCYVGKNIVVDYIIVGDNIKPKDGIKLIPLLEFTPEVLKSVSKNFDSNAALNSLKNVVQLVKPIVVAVNNPPTNSTPVVLQPANNTPVVTQQNNNSTIEVIQPTKSTPPYNGNTGVVTPPNNNIPVVTPPKTAGYTGLIAVGIGALVIFGLTQGKKK